MNPALRSTLADELGHEVVGLRPVGGGDINRAFRGELAGGQSFFVKVHGGVGREFFDVEAHGLRWLAEAGALRIPRVLAVGATDAEAFLALEWIESGRRAPDHDERLGRGLAAIHRAGAPSFGLDRDNVIGRLPQTNDPRPDWASFYRDCRLEPQIRMASEAGHLTESIRRGFQTLFGRLDELVGPPEPPARLHGDLWGGNATTDPSGSPCLIDPAVYGGHREVDLAMMRLFGGFGLRVFDAYHDAWALTDGHAERVGLYQLYPLMVHVNLFGGSYVDRVERTLRAYV